MKEIVSISPDVLDALNSGRQDLASVTHARKILEAAGCKVRLHQLELDEIKRLRKAAKKFKEDADAMEAMGDFEEDEEV
jgi:hypothetical protein